MRPYYAVVKDSFREALRSPVLWVFVALLTLFLGMLAPLGAREELNVRIDTEDVSNWPELARRLEADYQRLTPSPGKRIWSEFDPELREEMLTLEPPKPGDGASVLEFLTVLEQATARLNEVIQSDDLYDSLAWHDTPLSREGEELLDKGVAELSTSERQRLHRLAIEAAYPDLIRARPRTSFIVSYAIWEPLPPLPLRKETFHEILGTIVAYMSDWIVGLGVILVAALVTAPIVPRMFDQGQLHLLLSKPVSRSLLLLFQFIGACAYVFLLTAYLVGGLWLILGARFDYWDIKLLWMVPVYVFMFAIYYTVSVAAAVVWRNTLMAIISSVLFYIACFLLGFSTLRLEEGMMRPQRFVKLVPADDKLLAVTEGGLVNAWNEQERTWELAFLPEELESLGNFAKYMDVNLRMVGPVYVPEHERIAAVQLSLSQGQGPANVMQQVVAIGNADQQWNNLPGVTAPVGTFAIFAEPEGSLLVTSGLGIYRLTGNPTARREPPKILGFSLPIGAGTPFNSVGPEGLVFAPPAVAAFHAESRRLAVYTQGKLLLFAPGAEGRYELAAERALDTTASESVILALGAKDILIGRGDGRVQVLSLARLADKSETRPEPSSAPRFLVAAPDGNRFAVVCHNGRLWTYDSQADEWQRASVKGQGDVSGAAFDRQNRLLVAEHTNRVSVYEADSLALAERYSPRLDAVQRTYYYGLKPAYTLLPKPGEFYNTMQYLMSGKTTVGGAANEDLTSAQRKLRPWAPIWSGLGFMVVVLTATCVYFERQEY